MTARQHPDSHYSFAPGIDAYSGGVRAAPGHEIVHVNLRESLPWRQGFEAVDSFMTRQSLDRRSLCAIELRCPRPHTFEGFKDFNQEYRAVLDDWDLLVDGDNPVARTNVAPVVGAPSSTHVHAFGLVVPKVTAEGPSFIVAGAGDLVDQTDLSPGAIVTAAPDDPSPWPARIGQVMDEMETRMAALDVGWDDTTNVDVYCAGDWFEHASPEIVERMGRNGLHGVHWYGSHPPILGLSFEMDVRGVAVERWI